MTNLIKTTLLRVGFTLTVLMVSVGHSHGEHGHDHEHVHKEISQESIQNRAKAHLLKLVKDDKLDKSWSDINSTEAKKKRFGHHTEWVVDFNNTKIKEEEKQTLYIFLSLYGKITGANYSGK